MTDEVTGTTEAPAIGAQSAAEPARGPSIRDALEAAYEKADSGAPETAPTGEVQASADVEATDAEVAPASEASATTSPRPEHWSEEDWADLQKLPPAQQQYVLKKEKEFQAGFTRKSEALAEQRKRVEAFERTLGDLRAQYAPQADESQWQQTLVQTMPMLVQYYASLQRDPLETLTRLAESYGITDKLTERLAGLDTDEGAKALRRKEQEIADREARLQAETQKARRESLEATINSFREAKDESGNLKHPYFADVETEMATLIAANPKLTLDDAYDRAVKIVKHDEILAQAKERAKAEAEAARRAKIKDVRKPPVPNGRSGRPQAKTYGSTREALLDAFAQYETQA